MKDPNAKNSMPGASSKGFSPKSGDQHPPLPGAHKIGNVHVIPGGHNSGGSVIHPSLRKGK